MSLDRITYSNKIRMTFLKPDQLEIWSISPPLYLNNGEKAGIRFTYLSC